MKSRAIIRALVAMAGAVALVAPHPATAATRSGVGVYVGGGESAVSGHVLILGETSVGIGQAAFTVGPERVSFTVRDAVHDKVGARWSLHFLDLELSSGTVCDGKADIARPTSVPSDVPLDLVVTLWSPLSGTPPQGCPAVAATAGVVEFTATS